MMKPLLDVHTHTVAHISFQIADYERLRPLLAETDFPDELIMNYWPERFFEYLGIEL